MRTEAEVMMTMTQDTNCVVKTDKVQAFKLTLGQYMYKSRSDVLCKIIAVYCSLQLTVNVQSSDISDVFSPKF